MSNEVIKHYDELIIKYDKEVMRLNKIINDLEKYLDNEINNISLQVPYSCNPTLGQSIYQDVLEKLKELKGK